MKRKKESRVYEKHQLVGLEIAELLGDFPHKALYIKMAKKRDPEELLRLAKDVAGRERVRKRGAYFMRLVYGSRGVQGVQKVQTIRKTSRSQHK